LGGPGIGVLLDGRSAGFSTFEDVQVEWELNGNGGLLWDEERGFGLGFSCEGGSSSSNSRETEGFERGGGDKGLLLLLRLLVITKPID